MKKVKIPHNANCKSKSHDEHLCCLVSQGVLSGDVAKYKKLIKDAEFICLYCGRLAKDIESLCVPERL
jgi:hypothetical protein